VLAFVLSFGVDGWRVVFVGFVNRAKIAKWTTAGQAIIIYRILEPYLPHHPTKSYANEGPRQPHPPNLNTATTTPSFHLSWTIEGEERCVKSGATTMINYHRRNIVEICGWQSVVVCGSVRRVWTAMLIVVQAAAVAASMGDGCGTSVAMVLGVASLTQQNIYIIHVFDLM